MGSPQESVKTKITGCGTGARGPLVRPEPGSDVTLYPHKPWMLDGSGEHPPMRRYRIAEWHGSEAWMECGATFLWSSHLGFLL
jgi:hypothetical protein